MEESWRAGAKRPLVMASLVIVAYLSVEITGAVVSGSLALLADAAHTGSDVAALGLALLATWAAGKPHTAQRSFGYLRAEVLSALVNGTALLAIAVFIFVEAAQRIAAPPEVRGGIVSIVASGGLAANLVAAAILLRSSHQSLNIRGALYHVLGDAIGSAGAIVGGLLVLLAGWQWADPAVSIFIGLILVYGALKIVREATHVLLEGTPAHIPIAELRDDIESVNMVHGCHDLHTWTITSGYDALSAHVTVTDECPADCVRDVRGELGRMLRSKYGISHVTIQMERTDGDCEEEVHVPGLTSDLH
ncbi:MAG: cation diffusion facilitator family transporter [Chloroflexi bacterium]|nr:cation diffusion facilitator family transporter [Chloroflexota bacterium]